MFLVIISALSLVSCCETLYVVIRAGPISRHAVRMLSLCVYYDLYGLKVSELFLKKKLMFSIQLSLSFLSIINSFQNALKLN